MNKRRQFANVRAPCVTVAVVVLFLPARLLAASPETVEVRVTFVNPITSPHW